MSSIDNNIAVLQAIKDGKSVQYKFQHEEWRDCSTDWPWLAQGCVDFSSWEWRVKPEEKFLFAFVRNTGSEFGHEMRTERDAAARLQSLNENTVIPACTRYQPYTMKKYAEVVE